MKKTCVNCKHAVWKVDSRGRNKYESAGDCDVNVVIPHSYHALSRKPEKQFITKWTKEDCPCWEKKEKKNNG